MSYKKIKTINELANSSNYSFIEKLTPDPKSNPNGIDYNPRQVFNGHYVTVKPTPIENPQYISHSKKLFEDLGLDDSLAHSSEFMSIFSADLSNVPKPMRKTGWATGYALSIYGREYYEQCPFKTGNGYGDGRAISIFEGILNGKNWEMQLKGSGKTPYCRGADGRAVLRSSIREFLAQEHMHALNVPTSRSLSLFSSKTETVKRPWFNKGSHSKDPEVMIDETVAITTRVAPSFIRVGQLELFARRARKNEHPQAMIELEQIVLHLIEREYSEVIDEKLNTSKKVLMLANEFQDRLTSLVANWIRVGYCQGNFNSDNCSAGGITLDYGPFGFMDMFDPKYQPWTGGGMHFAFLNQRIAAERNFTMFCNSLMPLIDSSKDDLRQLEDIQNNFSKVMKIKMEQMWALKLGLTTFDEQLFKTLFLLMIDTGVDYTIFFRELSKIPSNISDLKNSFYNDVSSNEILMKKWSNWLDRWRKLIDAKSIELKDEISNKMKSVNPKYTLREWYLVEAYEQANKGDYTLIKELQEIMNNPYDEQSEEIEKKYYNKKPTKHFDIAGISHVSCSS